MTSFNPHRLPKGSGALTPGGSWGHSSPAVDTTAPTSHLSTGGFHSYA
jgi:hypothetical protein